MRIIISPAKSMKSDFSYNQSVTIPVFINKTKDILNTLTSFNKEELTKIWKCNSKMIDELCGNMLQSDLYKNLTPAIFAYDGLVYKNINPSSFNNTELNYIKNNLRILSGFYGVLHPFDGVIKYRLEMQAKFKLGNFNNLYAYWSDLIYQEVIDDSRIIINLASKEYSKAIEPFLTKEDKIINFSFLEKDNDGFVSKNTYSKIARGLLVHYLVKNNITDIESIKNFNLEGYKFNKELSNNTLFVFTR